MLHSTEIRPLEPDTREETAREVSKASGDVIATVALFVAIGGETAAYASELINGSQIKNHSIAAKKLTNSAIKSLRGQRGPTVPQEQLEPLGPP